MPDKARKPPEKKILSIEGPWVGGTDEIVAIKQHWDTAVHYGWERNGTVGDHSLLEKDSKKLKDTGDKHSQTTC